MKALWVEDMIRPLSFAEAATAMRLAIYAVYGADPAPEVLALALAKTALETGRWRSIHRFNWGNIKAGEAYPGRYTTFRCNELINGKLEWFDPTSDGYTNPPGHPQTRFRAYDSASEGASDYIGFVSGGRYKGAWARLLAGDAIGYVHALKTAGYFTAAEGPYRDGVVSLQREFLAKLKAEAPAPAQIDHAAIVASINDEDRVQVEQNVALWLDDQIHPNNGSIVS